MNDEQWKLWLAAYGAIISTLLVAKEYLYSFKHRLRVSARSDPPYENLQIKIVNIGKRPATVSSVEILYGPEPYLAEPIISYTRELPRKLEDGDELPAVTILRDEIVLAAKQKITQSMKHRVWVTVHLSTGKRVNRVVNIDPSIIPKPYWDREEPYIASDLFLGFPIMDHRIKNL